MNNTIIIKLNKKIKSINQFSYDEIINSINFHLIHCPNCQLSDWSTHAYYSRHVDFFNRRHTVRILRVNRGNTNRTNIIMRCCLYINSNCIVIIFPVINNEIITKKFFIQIDLIIFHKHHHPYISIIP
ncbi:hypothetical protein HMPREF3037_02800 [Candidatus Stoquefichus sp. KLE1796]|nr:hypothetical protein HMPREF3037_02800 [Candidatus Stoquefichus sp. KLE1796]